MFDIFITSFTDCFGNYRDFIKFYTQTTRFKIWKIDASEGSKIQYHSIGSISSTVVFLDRLVSSLTVHFRTLNTKNGPLLLYFQKSLFWKNQNWDSLDWRKIWHLGFNFKTLELSKLSVLNISDFKSFKSIIWLFNSLLSG